MSENQNEIVIYQPDESVRMDGRLRMKLYGENEWYDKVIFASWVMSNKKVK